MLIKNTERNVTPLFSTALRLMSVALFLSVGLVLLAQSAFAQTNITVQELRRKIDSGEKFVLIDVREPYENEEFNIGGNLIPMGNFPMVIQRLEDHKDKELIVYCKTGRRSASVQFQLMQAGFKNVRNVEGGIDEWKRVFENKQGGEKPTPETPPSKTPPPPPPKTPNQSTFIKIYVGNLSAETTEETLRNAFAEFGEVKSVKMGKDGDNNPIGFVEMAAGAADEAINQLNESELDGNEIVVRKAKADEGN